MIEISSEEVLSISRPESALYLPRPLILDDVLGFVIFAFTRGDDGDAEAVTNSELFSLALRSSLRALTRSLGSTWPLLRPVGRRREPPRLLVDEALLMPWRRSTVFCVGDTGCEVLYSNTLAWSPKGRPSVGSCLFGLSGFVKEDMAESIDPLWGVGVLRLKEPVLSRSEEANAFSEPLLSWLSVFLVSAGSLKENLRGSLGEGEATVTDERL